VSDVFHKVWYRHHSKVPCSRDVIGTINSAGTLINLFECSAVGVRAGSRKNNNSEVAF